MATEKILNTKVLLRYDTLANWQSTAIAGGGANYVPKKGEACVYEIPTGASVDGVKNPPAIMIKVGDGTSKVSALPWTAATAADVYAWAKKSGIEIEEATGDYVTGISWNNTTNKIVVAKASFDNSGNVKFSKTEDGNIKATVSISDVKVDNALHAETADSATEAGKATNDGAGNSIVDTYATKAEIEANRNLWTKDTVTTATGKDAIKVEDIYTNDTNYDYKVELVINEGTPGNVTLTQDANGLKANTTPVAIGAVSTDDFNTFKTNNTAAIGTAKSEAIAAAAEDATTKANTAESNAKEYTDDEIVGLELEHSGQSIILKNKAGTTVATLDASAFYVDGMVSDATYDATTNKLTITFNTAAGKNAIDVDLNDLVDVYTGGTGITVGTDGKISITDGGVGTTQLANNAVTTEKIADGNVTKAKLASDVQTSLDKADTALQEVKWQINNSVEDTYFLNADTSVTIPSKDYVDDAIASVTGGKVEKAEKDGEGNVITETYKVKQNAVVDPTTNGKSLTFIDTISQNTEGVITATKKEVNLDAYALKTDIPEIPDIVITETKGALGSAGTIFVSGKLEEDTATGHTISQPMFGLTQMGDIEFITAEQTVEQDVNTTTAVSFAIKDKAVTAEKTAAYTTENPDGTHTASTEVWVLYGGSATENI